MMLLALLSAGLLAVLLLMVWTIRGGARRSLGEQTAPRFYAVDIAAFRNLLSQDEEDFLRSALTKSSYRKVRRARLRAVQEYLLWIAANCATLIATLRLRISNPELDSPLDTEALVQQALRLRLISLGFWTLLWIEFLLPTIHIRPSAAAKRYEDVWQFAESSFRTKVLEPVVVSSQTGSLANL
jgi:hypothetical protein